MTDMQIVSRADESAHWYTQAGEPCHEIARSDGKGMRPTTLRDARKLGLVPSVTTLLKSLDRPALTKWKIDQAVLTALTAPRLNGESIDAFTQRIFSDEAQHEAEGQKARDLGTQIHADIEAALAGNPPADQTYTTPVLAEVETLGKVAFVERIVVGKDYAGKIDAAFDIEGRRTLVDFKTAKKIPTTAYLEHRLQLAAYAGLCVGIHATANVYISTTEPGVVKVCVHDEPWQETLERGFRPVIAYWQWANDYVPGVPEYGETR